MTTTIYTIEDANYDSYQTGAVPGSGSPNLSSTLCNANATTHFGGHYFVVTGIRHLARINSCYFRVWFLSGSLDDPDHTIHFQNGMNPPTPSASTDDVSGRPRTTGVTWTASGLGASAYKDGPDMSADLQTLVDNALWSVVSQPVFVITVGKVTGNSRWAQYDNAVNQPPQLVIDYTNPYTLPPVRRTRTYIRL